MRTRQGETICLGERIRPASADFPPAGGVWGGMRAGFGLGVFGKFAVTKKSFILICFKFWCNIIIVIDKWTLHYNVITLMMICQTIKI